MHALRPRATRRALLAMTAPLALATAAHASDVTTYHFDAQRTGYNSTETILNQSTVASSAFHKLQTIPLVTQMDAQPLVISAATMSSWGYAKQFPHDVVYIADEANNVFAIDSITGAILLQKNFGTPVAQANLPGQCGNNAGTVGINGTPVIDSANKLMYFITYSWENSAAVYRIHEMNLLDLSEKVPSVVISAKGTLSDGSAVNFPAYSQRQRTAMLFANGNLYAGFGSFCDQNDNVTRGWLLGWQSGSLTPLAAELTQQQTNAQSTNNPFGGSGPFFLSGVWMSGYGPAADSAGNVYFLTGNSDGIIANNLPDALIRMPPNLAAVTDYFIPANFAALDAVDEDRGSGGAMVVPDQSSGLQFAVSQGKDGRLFLHNRAANLGGYVPNGPDLPTSVNAGMCWCGPAYFVGADGKPRIVSTGATQIATWLLPASATGTLAQESIAPALPNRDGGDPGFMASTSSNGTTANSALIWAVSRFDNGQVYLQATAGTPSGGATSIYDRAGNAWSFGTVSGGNGQILINGQPAYGGYAADIMTDSTGTLWQMNSAGQWWTYNGAGGWTGQGTTPNFAVPSPAGLYLTPAANSTVTDAAGNVWSFGGPPSGSNYPLFVNGSQVQGAYGIKIVIDTTGTMWHTNSGGYWYSWNGNGWTNQAAAPTFTTPSPAGALVTPSSGGVVTDKAGRIWSFGPANPSVPANYQVLVNGQPAYGAWGVKIVIDTAGTMWHTNAQGGWWYYNGNGGWTGASGPTLPPVWTPGATVSVPGRLPRLRMLPAGYWPIAQSNSNLVPVVANGRVYVASYGQLSIFGLGN